MTNKHIALAMAGIQTINFLLIGAVPLPASAQSLPQPTDPNFAPDPNLGDRPFPDLLQNNRDRLLRQRDTLPEIRIEEPPPDPQTEFSFYRLGPGDSIGVTVLRFPDLNFQALIDPEGNITLPLLGRVSLTGLTLEQAQERIRFGLNRFIIDPVVLLSLNGIRPVEVTVTGEVGRPGVYALPNPPFVTDAVVAANGTTPDADLRKIRVRRTLEDGSVIEQTTDLLTPLAQGSALQDLRLLNGDIVFVERLDPNDPDYDRALAANSNLTQPFIRILVLSYAGRGFSSIQLATGSDFVDALAVIGVNPDVVNMRDVVLIRFDEQQRRAVSRSLNAKRAILGDQAQNPLLRENDVIVVGRNLVSRITFALGNFTQPFRDILGFLLFFRQLQRSSEDLFGPTQGGGSSGSSN